MLLGVSAFAQTTQDIIFLKNGTVVKGSIIEQILGQSVKLKTASGDIISYKMDDVERFEKDATSKASVNFSTIPQSQTKKSVYISASLGLNTSLASGFNDMYNSGVSFKIAAFGKDGFGISTGYIAYGGKGNYEDCNFSAIPILLYWQDMMGKKDTKLKFYFDGGIGGYLVNTSGEYYLDGYNFENSSSKFYFGINIGAGLRYRFYDQLSAKVFLDADNIKIFSKSSTTLYGLNIGLIRKF